MAKRPVEFISFRFEPTGEGRLFNEPFPVSQTARLNLVIWRRKGVGGRPEVSEVHALGEARSIEEFDRLIDRERNNLESARREGRDWFAPRRPFWR